MILKEPIVHNNQLLSLMRQTYKAEEILSILEFLKQRGTFHFPTFETGLFSAAGIGSLEEKTSGYRYAWIRDNIHIIYAHFLMGDIPAAVRALKSIELYFKKHKWRFLSIIKGESDPSDPMQRPHIRFDGKLLEEINQKWAHAQNDSLGYFLWCYCRFIDLRIINAEDIDSELLSLFPQYWLKIRYWMDEDSGHWEEVRKISASSIGVAVAGLKELEKILRKKTVLKQFQAKEQDQLKHNLNDVISNGISALDKILPNECIQEDPKKNRRYDSALLFLIFPTGLLPLEKADAIIKTVSTNLQGDYGIRRYLGDSYWAEDYRIKIPAEGRTVDFSDNIDDRDVLLSPGKEAQWCIFDPILAVIYGEKFQETRNKEFLELATYYFNRSLGQITGNDSNIITFRCPEAYFSENGQYVPNDHTPLLWTQANLMAAFWKMIEVAKEK